MIVALQPDQISALWDAIKHGVCVANRIDTSKDQTFCNNLLAKLLSGKAQCWVSYEKREDTTNFRAFGVTTIEESSLGERYFFLHTLYAYRPIPETDLQEIIPMLQRFARSQGCAKMITFTYNARLAGYYKSQGMTQDLGLYTKEI